MVEKPIKITIRSSDGGTDAPTVNDLLGQVEDFVHILEGVEESIASDGKKEIVWRVTDASKNSPLTFEITPFADNPAMNITNRVMEVESAAIGGLSALQRGVTRPMHFTDTVLRRARNLHSRVQNGLAETTFSVDSSIASSPVVLNRRVADSFKRTRELSKIQMRSRIESWGALRASSLVLNLTGFIGPYSRYGRASTVPSSRRLQGSVRTNSLRESSLAMFGRVPVFASLDYFTSAGLASLNM